MCVLFVSKIMLYLLPLRYVVIIVIDGISLKICSSVMVFVVATLPVADGKMKEEACHVYTDLFDLIER